MPIELGRRLVAAGLVPREEVEAALFSCVVRGVPFARALIDRGALTERVLEEELGRRGGPALRQVVGAADLVERLPRAMCRRLAAIPLRRDPETGRVDVAAADPLDAHIVVEFRLHLGAPIRVLRAPLSAIEEAIRRIDLGSSSRPQRRRRETPAFPHGAPDSSIPPPPTNEVPIPLVRRLGVPLIDPDEEVAPVSVRPTGSGEWETVAEPMAPSRRAMREMAEGTPSVTFPSDAPPAPTTARLASDSYASISDADSSHDPGPRAGAPTLPFASPDGVMRAIREAGDRDEVVRQALRGLRLVARRVAVFAVKKDGFHGWACNVEFGDAAALRALVIPGDTPSALSTAAAASMYLGPIPDTEAHAALLRIMVNASRDVAFAVARLAGKPVLVLVADDLGDTLQSTRRMTELANAVGDALTRIVKSSR